MGQSELLGCVELAQGRLELPESEEVQLAVLNVMRSKVEAEVELLAAVEQKEFLQLVSTPLESLAEFLVALVEPEVPAE